MIVCTHNGRVVAEPINVGAGVKLLFAHPEWVMVVRWGKRQVRYAVQDNKLIKTKN